MTRRPSQPRITHAVGWYSAGLAVLFVVYCLIVWYLEKVHFPGGIIEMMLTSPTAVIYLVGKFLRHLVPIAVGWWFAYNAAVITIQHLYNLPDRDAARQFLRSLRSPTTNFDQPIPLTSQTLEADRPGLVILRVGGPGRVQVKPFNVAVTEDNGVFARLLPPGKHQLRPYEYVHAVIDLREQTRQTADEDVRTRDNVDMKAAFTIAYRISTGGEKPSKTQPYPYDETAVRAAAYAQTVLSEHLVLNWESKPISTTRSKLAAAVGRYRLDELMHPDGRADEPYRTLQREVHRTARTELARSGIELISFAINRLEPANPVIANQYIAFWQSSWQGVAELNKADATARATEEKEIARAEAEVAMIEAILEGIRRARRSGATTHTSEIVALRLIEGLERMAEKSQVTRTMLPILTEVHSDILASTLLPPPQPQAGSEPS